MESKTFIPRSKEYWAGRALERRSSMDQPLTTGPASDVRRIDPTTGHVIEDIKSEEEARAQKPSGRRGRRSEKPRRVSDGAKYFKVLS